jgi:hypothetical protein
MKSHLYSAEVAERYLEYLHSGAFAPRARKKQNSFARLTIADIPFWKSINLGELLTEVRQDNADLFVNISLDPEDYHSYLSRVVPYSEKIVLADPIATLYEWRDRSMLDSEQFQALFDQALNIILPLCPLIESGILLLLPQPLLWSNGMERCIGQTEDQLLSNRQLCDSFLTDYEKGLGKQEVIIRWLDSQSRIPDGWKENPEAYAEVNIVMGELNDLVNGLLLTAVVGGNITTSSINTWHHIQKAAPILREKDESNATAMAEILPLAELPYMNDPDWDALVRFRQDCDLFAGFRKELHQIYRDLQDHGPSSIDSFQRASQFSQILRSRVSELQRERQHVFNDFRPALAKTLIAGISAMLGSQPLTAAFVGLALIDACKTVRNFRLDAQRMKRNPLTAVFSESSEQ